MAWLVTGGAGYIGAHVVRRLVGRHEVVVYDDLSTGRPHRLPAGVVLVEGAMTDERRLAALLRHHRVEGVVHLAARKAASASFDDVPAYRRDVDAVGHLLRAMAAADVDRLVFASTAAVYGDVRRPVREATPARPGNPYGQGKADAEHLIARAGLRSIVLRMFNVAGTGSHPDAADREPSALLPAVFRAIDDGVPLPVFGDGHLPGGPVRDYVHVLDVARAFGLGADLLSRNRSGPAGHLVVNIGSGTGRSVADVVRTVTAITGRAVETRSAPRRRGDPLRVIADVRRATAWGWTARRQFTDAVRTSWDSWREAMVMAGSSEDRES